MEAVMVQDLLPEHQDRTWRDRYGFTWAWIQWASLEWDWGMRNHDCLPWQRCFYDRPSCREPFVETGYHRPQRGINCRADGCVCSDCHGSGREYLNREVVYCDTCKGTGGHFGDGQPIDPTLVRSTARVQVVTPIATV